jgi:PPM family protein phosphatase
MTASRGLDITAPPACPRCAAPVTAGDRFCEVCGTDLRGVPAVVRVCPHCGDGGGADGWCSACGLRLPDGADHVEVVVTGGAAVSDRGHVRPRNEDAVALGRGPAGRGPAAPVAAVVCDGVSSIPGSERAARAAADATLARLLDAGGSADRERHVRAAVAAGAAAAAGLVPAGTRNAPSCTLVCGVVDPADPAAPVLTVAWVGDSRAYWLAAGGTAPPRLLTADHVAANAPPGLLDPAVVAARPDAITRWLGAEGGGEPDIVTHTAVGPGVLLLCTDGLWKYLPDAAALSAVALPSLYAGGPSTAAQVLTATALTAGGEDNVTVAVLPVVPVPLPAAPVPRSSS